jgi:hypothetical protein
MDKVAGTPITFFRTKWATITSIAYPGKVEKMEDLYDFRVLVTRLSDKVNFDLYFTVEIDRIEIKQEKHPVQMLKAIYGALLAHLRSPFFVKQYGEVALRVPREGRMNEERRLNIELDRIFVREPAQMTFISDIATNRNNPVLPKGLNTVVVRLPRGFTVKLLPAVVEQDVEAASGHAVLFNQLFYFYVHRPPMTEAALVSNEVLDREFQRKISETFPFGDFSQTYLIFRGSDTIDGMLVKHHLPATVQTS